MKNFKLFISAFICYAILLSCENHSKKSTALPPVFYRTIKLDSTLEYKITIPNNYRIEKLPGPDFEVYSLSPSDTSVNYTNGGIYFGGHPQPIAPLFEIKLKKDSLISGRLLGNKIDWTIYEYDSLFSAQTILNLDTFFKIHAFTYATSYLQLDTLIRAMESLNKRK